MTQQSSYWEVREGYPVFTVDGEKLGRVAETRGDAFKVDAPWRRDFWLRRDSILSVVPGERITVDAPANDLDRARSEAARSQRENQQRSYGDEDYYGYGSREYPEGSGGREPRPQRESFRWAERQYGYDPEQRGREPRSGGDWDWDGGYDSRPRYERSGQQSRRTESWREDPGAYWRSDEPEAPGRGESWEQWRQRQSRSEERGAYEGKGPRGYKPNDDRIREDVSEALTRDGYVDASDMEVSVTDCEVRLSGTVETRAQRRRAEEIACQIPGVREVMNEVKTQATMPTSGSESSSLGGQ